MTCLQGWSPFWSHLFANITMAGSCLTRWYTSALGIFRDMGLKWLPKTSLTSPPSEIESVFKWIMHTDVPAKKVTLVFPFVEWAQVFSNFTLNMWHSYIPHPTLIFSSFLFSTHLHRSGELLSGFWLYGQDNNCFPKHSKFKDILLKYRVVWGK